MEKRSRRRTRDLVTQAASQGLSENEIGCARISMMARSTNAPCKGRIQMRKTNPLHLLTFGLQRTAGPYRGSVVQLRRRVHDSSFRDAQAVFPPRPRSTDEVSSSRPPHRKTHKGLVECSRPQSCTPAILSFGANGSFRRPGCLGAGQIRRKIVIRGGWRRVRVRR